MTVDVTNDYPLDSAFFRINDGNFWVNCQVSATINHNEVEEDFWTIEFYFKDNNAALLMSLDELETTIKSLKEEMTHGK